MKLTCVECKNNVDMSRYPTVTIDDKIECDVCGILLAVTSISGDEAEAEVVDEGK